MFYHRIRPPATRSGAHVPRRGPIQRAPRAHQLLVPRRRLALGGPGGAGCRTGLRRPGGDRPPGPLRGGPFRKRRAGGWAAADRRHGGRAARCRGPGPRWGRGAPSAPSTPRVAGPGGRGWPAERRRLGRRRGHGIRHGLDIGHGLGRRGSAGPPQRRATASAWPPRAEARGAASGARSRARPAPRPAGPRHDRLSQPLPAGQRRPPGRHQGRAALHAGAAGRACRGSGGALRLPPR